MKGFPCGSAGKELACNVGDLGSIPGLGRSPGEGNRNPLQYSCLENSMDRIVVRHNWATSLLLPSSSSFFFFFLLLLPSSSSSSYSSSSSSCCGGSLCPCTLGAFRVPRSQAAAPPSRSTLTGAEMPQTKKVFFLCTRVTVVVFDSLWPCGLWPARLLCQRWGFSRQEYQSLLANTGCHTLLEL